MILLWGSNARETHPIFFHHLLKGVHNGAQLFVIDPRRTSSAQWADRWLGLDVGSDIALSNTMAREILHAGLANQAFIEHATEGFEAYAESVEPFTLAEGERLTGVPAEVIRETAHALRAGRPRHDLLDARDHRAPQRGRQRALADQPRAALRARRPFRLGAQPAARSEQRAGRRRHGSDPEQASRLPGHRAATTSARSRFEQAWDTTIRPSYGWHLTQMFHGMERGELRTLYVIGENPAQSEADITQTRKLLADLDFLVVQDIVLTRTAEMADVVFPSAASWCEADGTVTNSERRVQRVRKALDPPGEARDDMWIIAELARRLGYDWPEPVAEEVWDELRSLSPMHAGMSYARLEEHGGLQWPCPDENHPGSPLLHDRLWAEPLGGPPAPFSVVEAKGPFEELDADYPIRLTTGRRLESFNTGAQTNLYSSPLHRGESLDLSPEDAERLELSDGEIARVSSRRGSVEAPVRIDPSLRPGLAFMTFHFPDQVDTNQLTIDVTDPKSGTAEFKAAAIRVEKLEPAGVGGLMDLHLVPGAEPTAAESAALDTVLGLARDGWDGGARLSGPEGNTASTGHVARERRHLLLPALWALQERIGWISPGGVNELCRRLTVPPADVYGVATFYAMLAVEPRPARVVHVCEDIACRCNGSDELIAQLEERFGGEGELSADGSTTWYRSPCLGQCDRAPAALVGDAGDEPRERTLAPVTAAAVLDVLAGAEPGPAPVTVLPQAGDPSSAPAAAGGRRRRREASTRTSDDGGYSALRRAIELGPEGVIRELKDSKLQGRGGAAFPTGVKWEAVAAQAAQPHYLVCNADESEPGTFKDRVIVERDPFALIEAMTIAAYATGCERGYLYIRGEYPEPQHALEAALIEARQGGFLGGDVLGAGFGLRDRGAQGCRCVHLRRGDGDLRVDRGIPRRAAQQAAVPGRPGALREADGRQQRRDARQRPRHRPALGRGVCGNGHGRFYGNEAVLSLGPCRAPRGLRGARSGRRFARCSSSREALRATQSCSAS